MSAQNLAASLALDGAHLTVADTIILRGLVSGYVFGNISQIIPKLMSTPIEYADNRLWESCCIQCNVGKRYYFIIATVIQEDPGY